MSQEKIVLCDAPNKFARSPQIELYEHSAVFHGYQEFILTRDTVSVLPEDSNLQAKQTLLAPYFEPRYLRKRTVLDLGANAGFFCFWALQKGAEKAVAVDMDDFYLQMVREAKTHLEFHDLDVVKANVADQNDSADIVLATALVHWIYSCTALFGCLDAVVAKLARLTNYMLIVEWIEPQDSAIGFFRHTDWNKSAVSGPYDLSTFEKALANNFKRYCRVGDVSPTRRLYVAFNTEHEIDLSAPLPLIMPEKALIYSKLLTKNDGMEYWSRVYDGGEVIKKQATLDLASREAFFLSQFESDYFPKVLSVKSERGYSLLTLEKIDGQLLPRAAGEILATPSSLWVLIQHCLWLLGELADKGITHRDIRPDNILFRNCKPVLIDFGWAVSDAKPYFTPRFLGGIERPRDGSFCDVYSMGKVLKGLNDGRYPEFDLVLDLMVEEDASLRVIDLHMLEALLRVIVAQ